jgi:hypothetical protein
MMNTNARKPFKCGSGDEEIVSHAEDRRIRTKSAQDRVLDHAERVCH